MHKKILTACISLVAFTAFALVPAIASASPVLTETAGTALAAGSEITGTQDGTITMTSNLGNIECNESDLKGTLKENSGTSIKGEITGSTFKNNGSHLCPAGFGTSWEVEAKTPWCLEANSGMAKDTGIIKNGTCAKTGGTIKFVLKNAGGECEYASKSTTGIPGTYNTSTTPLTISLEENAEFTRIRTSGFVICPEIGKMMANYTLTTPNGTGLMIE